MRPGTVHGVLTTDHCIVSGGHFYNSTTFVESAKSIINDHYYGDVTTNTEHDRAIFYFFKIVCAYVEACDMQKHLEGENKGWECSVLFSFGLTNVFVFVVDLPSDDNIAALIFIVDHADQLSPYMHADASTRTAWVLSKEFASDFFYAKMKCHELYAYCVSITPAFLTRYSNTLKKFKSLIASLEKTVDFEGDKLKKIIVKNLHLPSL